MPRRASTRTAISATPQALAPPQQLETPYDSHIYQLRRHWKWAAFSQFFFTFSPLLAMSDVTLTDVENDLVHSTNRVLSRIMQRLLVTLTQDRKISSDSWQNALRRQYQRREPEASPISFMTPSQHFIVESSRASTVPPLTLFEVSYDEAERENESLGLDQSTAPRNNAVREESFAEDPGHLPAAKVEENDIPPETLEPPEEQIDWLDLSMLAKLESLYTLAEWQFQNPNRLRQQMKDDDEQATWRIEPIGYDAKRNAYWLIGSDRLWIQREPPRPNLKRKRKPSGSSKNTSKKQLRTVKRQRVDSNLESVGQPPASRSTRSKGRTQHSPSFREGRAAKTRANQRLDAQAKDIAEFQRQMASSRVRSTSVTARKPAGIRVSARLRGAVVENDEWQEVPDEWLAFDDAHQVFARDPSFGSSASKKRMKIELESENGSISELTELSDEDDTPQEEQDFRERPVVKTDPASAEKGTDRDGESQDEEAKAIESPVTPPPPDDFIEWETICVTLEEWESIGQQFERATHYAEKALYKVLSQTIVPMVTTELKEAEKKRQMNEAVVHRKRSSRIAMKEIEKEEERAAMRKRFEDDEKTSRARRLEARQHREQAERLKRENAREQRRKEREQQSAEALNAESKPDVSVESIQEETNPNSLPPGQAEALVALNAPRINDIGGGSRSSVENWELDCEICGRMGSGQDSGIPLLCCGICGKWQHIVCHDKQDTMAGRPRRNWDIEGFTCRKCSLMSCKTPPPSFLTFGTDDKRRQALSARIPYVSQSSHLGSHSNSGYHQDSSSNTRYPCDHSSLQTAVSPPSTHSYTSQSRSTGVTFAHYQPQQGGFSTSRPTYSLHEANSHQHTRYAIAAQTAPAAGTTPYPSTTHAIAHSPTHVHEQWHPTSSYPRTTSMYPINGGSPFGAQPYYNGHAHTLYSHIRGTTTSTVLGQHAGLHVPSYQRSK